MNIGKAYTFIPQEDGWIGKIVIAALVSLFSVLLLPGFFLVGYQLAIMRNVIKGEDHPLPAWENWGTLFMEGAIIWVTLFVYTLPVTLLVICSSLIVIPSAAAGEEISGAAIVGVVLMSCLILLLAIALAFIIPAVYIQFIRTGEVGSLFRFSEIINIAREDVVDILLAIVAAIAANLVLGIFTWIPVCGWFIIAPLGTAWIMISTAHLYGQIAAKDEGKIIDPALA